MTSEQMQATMKKTIYVKGGASDSLGAKIGQDKETFPTYNLVETNQEISRGLVNDQTKRKGEKRSG